MLIFPIFIPQWGCPFNCIYCDQRQFVAVKVIPFNTLRKQLSEFCEKNIYRHKQIAIYGGTFTALALSEREMFITLVKPFLNDKTSIRISTRPDCIDQDILDWCDSNGIRTIELGVQDFSDKVLLASNRGYNQKIVIDACHMIKQNGFELGIQIMPGLPGFLFNSYHRFEVVLHDIMPSFLRLYPVIVLQGTDLWREYQSGSYNPLSMEEAITVCADISEIAEKYNIKVIKIGIPSLEKGSVYAGPYHPAFGEFVKAERLIRKIVKEHKQQESIELPSTDISLLTGHKGYNLSRLLKRLGTKDLVLVAI